MSKRNGGERIARQGWERSESVEQQGKRIDRAIRREKAKAWDECVFEAAMRGLGKMKTGDLRAANPYRGRARR